MCFWAHRLQTLELEDGHVAGESGVSKVSVGQLRGQSEQRGESKSFEHLCYRR